MPRPERILSNWACLLLLLIVVDFIRRVFCFLALEFLKKSLSKRKNYLLSFSEHPDRAVLVQICLESSFAAF